MENTVQKRGYHALIAYIAIHVVGASIIALIAKVICQSLHIDLEIEEFDDGRKCALCESS